MVVRPSVCLRRLARGRRSQQVGFGRFLANPKVTVERLIEGWSDRTSAAVAGRHVLAIHDTSEINFRTTPKRRRGLGEIGKGNGRGLSVARHVGDRRRHRRLPRPGRRDESGRGAAGSRSRTRNAAPKTRNPTAGSPPPNRARPFWRRPPRVTVTRRSRERHLRSNGRRLPEPDFHLISALHARPAPRHR